ncbi:hypothetical protein JOC95_000314 [Bacillus tianshenii]|uniref:DUF4625 domain-containing protein n=1 Tax=Sutcliffiella tianshenii TaxID=1463404 RepID=A0ABS2NV44_9BACI|nr:hypothetical protein [Bacillus tianshenii]MBM7618472.1 hypothetical protein [Bacillus tianshenii]
MKNKRGCLLGLFLLIGLMVGCSEETSEKKGIGYIEIGIGRDEEMEVADVTDTFTVNDIIAVTYGQDEEPIGGSVTFIILKKIGINEEIINQWEEPLDPTWTWFSIEIYPPEEEGDYILRLASGSELLAEKSFSVE